MKHELNFVNTGGFPLDVDKLEDLQQAYSIFENMANLAGHATIISGCVNTAGLVSDGVVAINGKLYPFVGGAIGAKVIVESTPSNLPYEDGVSRLYKTQTTAKFGTGPGEINWVDFLRIDSIRDLMTNKLDKSIYDAFETTVNTFMGQVDDEYISSVSWTSTPSLAPIVFASSWPGIVGTDFRKETGDAFSGSPSVRKHKTGFVSIKGTFNRDRVTLPTFDADYSYSDSSWYTLLYLPVGYRPVKTIIRVLQPNIWLKIMPTGDVRIYSTLGSDFMIFLDSIPMFFGY